MKVLHLEGKVADDEAPLLVILPLPRHLAGPQATSFQHFRVQSCNGSRCVLHLHLINHHHHRPTISVKCVADSVSVATTYSFCSTECSLYILHLAT